MRRRIIELVATVEVDVEDKLSEIALMAILELGTRNAFIDATEDMDAHRPVIRVRSHGPEQ